MKEGAIVAFPLGAPLPPEPAAEHAVVASNSAAARVKSTRLMALTS
jgi:hypothetical protein